MTDSPFASSSANSLAITSVWASVRFGSESSFFYRAIFSRISMALHIPWNELGRFDYARAGSANIPKRDLQGKQCRDARESFKGASLLSNAASSSSQISRTTEYGAAEASWRGGLWVMCIIHIGGSALPRFRHHFDPKPPSGKWGNRRCS